MSDCINRQFGCSCTDECQDHWEVTKAKLIALDEDAKAKTREHGRMAKAERHSRVSGHPRGNSSGFSVCPCRREDETTRDCGEGVMSNVIDPAGEEVTLFDASQSALKTIDKTRKEFAMGNAVEIQTAKQMAQVEQRAFMTPMEMLDKAVSQGADVETLSKLMDLQERWEANQARKAFEGCNERSKAELPKIVKNKKVDFTTQKGRTNYQYEDLASIMNQIGPVLSRHGLSVRYRTTTNINEPVTVTCIISHSMGHSEENTLMAGRDDSGNKNSIQQIGSTVTYLQRYTLKAALGLAAGADDDGAKADDAGNITEAERQVIMGLIDETQADIAKFCEALQIDSVAENAGCEVPPRRCHAERQEAEGRGQCLIWNSAARNGSKSGLGRSLLPA